VACIGTFLGGHNVKNGLDPHHAKPVYIHSNGRSRHGVCHIPLVLDVNAVGLEIPLSSTTRDLQSKAG
jgi:hypothetical protein